MTYTIPTVAVQAVTTPHSVTCRNLDRALGLTLAQANPATPSRLQSKARSMAERVQEARERGGFTLDYTMPSGTSVWTYERTDPAGVDKDGNPLRYTLHSDLCGAFSCTCLNFRPVKGCKHCEALTEDINPAPKPAKQTPETAEQTPEVLTERPGRACTRCGETMQGKVTRTPGKGYLITETCPGCGMKVVVA